MRARWFKKKNKADDSEVGNVRFGLYSLRSVTTEIMGSQCHNGDVERDAHGVGEVERAI
jgi:hypothetical protein